MSGFPLVTEARKPSGVGSGPVCQSGHIPSQTVSSASYKRSMRSAGRSGGSLRSAPVDRAAIARAWGDMLKGGAFDAWCTLTFRRSVGPQAADAAWADFMRWIRHKQGHRAEWFRVTETHRSGAIHFHALLGRCSGLRRLSALDYWRHRYGFGQVLPYDSRLGAPYYISKYVCKSADAELDCQFSRCFERLFGGVRSGKGGKGKALTPQGASLMSAPSYKTAPEAR